MNSSAKSIGTSGFQPLEQLETGVITKIADVHALECVFFSLKKDIGGVKCTTDHGQSCS